MRLADTDARIARTRPEAPMLDFIAARRMMVDGQVRTSDVTDARIIAAMLDLPRERFAPAGSAAMAYLDRDLPVGRGRFLLKPMVLAKLVQAAEIATGDRVLDVGCATGYSTAVLARLARSVVALEREAALVPVARENLAAAGARNVEVVTGALPAGWPAGAPYDLILLNGATEIAPEGLLAQLKDGGRLVGVVGRAPASKAMHYVATSGQASAVPVFDASAPTLPGFAAVPAFVF
jgi:protein-L-isoaspartate(D-aspartate) O-methyltransferase